MPARTEQSKHIRTVAMYIIVCRYTAGLAVRFETKTPDSQIGNIKKKKKESTGNEQKQL